MYQKNANLLFTTNIKKLLARENLTYLEFSKMLGVKPSTVSMWMSGANAPRMDMLDKIASCFQITVDELFKDTESNRQNAEEEMNGFFEFQILDDSMEPRMKSGDTVIVQKQEDAKTGDIIITTINNTNAACRRLKKYRDGIELIAANPNCEPVFFSEEEMKEKSVRIIGRVVELRAKF